jgi:pyrroline-5-carboxylate reductase
MDTPTSPPRSVAVLGCGKLGETILRGLLDAGFVQAEGVTVTAGHTERADHLAATLGVRGTLDNAEAARGADLVLLCVKPFCVQDVLTDVAAVLDKDTLLVSVAASVGTPAIEARLAADVPVVRAMPNTPCLIRQGMTGLCAGEHAERRHLDLAREVFEAVGRTVVVDEAHMDAVTGLSASGPAFLYMVVESLAEGGVKVGLPRDVATLLAAQTMAGAGAMVVETGAHPALLKDGVTTPAGCTMDGILELEEGGLRVALIKAVVKAKQRAAELYQGD